jgi:hypothetical protein
MTKKTTDRQRFAQWARREGYTLAKCPYVGGYESGATQFLWTGWQAALRSERRRGKR